MSSLSSSSSSSQSSYRPNRPQHEDYESYIVSNSRHLQRQRQQFPRLVDTTTTPTLSKQRQQRPLVLDPSASSAQKPGVVYSDAGGALLVPNNKGLVRKLLSAATTSSMTRREKQTQQQQQQEQSRETSWNALNFAKNAPKAGYLEKLGTNVVEFKRRFFVLCPTTYLYYFLSPHDPEPRGCMDLRGATIQDLGGLKFKLVLPEKEETCVILQARSEPIKQEWMQSLSTERLEYVKDELTRAKAEIQSHQEQIQTLQKEIQQYRHVEQDRDMALEDAAAWKIKYEQTEQAMRVLQQHLRQAPSSSNDNNNKEEETANQNIDDVKSEESNINRSHRETSLLDSVDDNLGENVLGDVHDPLHAIATDLDSQAFYSLLNASLQLLENIKLASTEASTAVQDLVVTNDNLAKIQKRMTKAERHLCKLWEENCTLRKSLKSTKREKRVLVREVKTLMATTATTTVATAAAAASSQAIVPVDKPQQEEAQQQQQQQHRQEEERLIHELEEHVLTSIKLQEQLLLAGEPKLLTNGGGGGAQNNQEAMVPFEQAAETASLVVVESNNTNINTLQQQIKIPKQQGSSGSEEQGMTAPPPSSSASSTEDKRFIASLADSDSDDEEDDETDTDSMAPSLVSLVAGVQTTVGSVPQQDPEVNDTDGNNDGDNDSEMSGLNVDMHESRMEEENPLNQLDESEEEPESFVQTNKAKPTVAQNGKATARLISPLADVVGTPEDASEDDGRMYHLTFYTKKIGLQFQKVPVPNGKSNGLLTEAMTADLGDAVVEAKDDKTASELSRLAAISRMAKQDETALEETTTCPFASPVDAVLVCGLKGFDESSQRPPKVGARLVAFDGVSVEVGNWTFDSVRKAIQARGRPLTLSFRNDMLTTKQRSILTKAVAEVNGTVVAGSSTAASRPPINPPTSERKLLGATPSSSDGEARMQAVDGTTERESDTEDTDDASMSTMASVSIASDRQSTARASPHSFSEAGSSSVVSAAFGPLMTNLMSSLSHNKEPFTPSYLRPEYSQSPENVAYHRQFKESLL